MNSNSSPFPRSSLSPVFTASFLKSMLVMFATFFKAAVVPTTIISGFIDISFATLPLWSGSVWLRII